MKFNRIHYCLDCHAAAAEMEAVRQRYSTQIQRAEASITALEKVLVKLVKQYEQEIMDGADCADLPAGAVMLKKEKRVRRIKGMLARLKKEGLKEAIKIANEYVNWDEVEKFDDKLLERLGTRRAEKKTVSYQLNGH